VTKVISDPERQVITAIVDEDQLSLAIGRNGQNVRLASQLIGWQIDLYGSREWLERGADAALFGSPPQEEGLETADFPLAELSLPEGSLAALNGAGYSTFLDIIDLGREDFLKVEGLDEAAADELLRIIDELTVVEGEEEPVADEASADASAASDAGTAAEDADAEAVAEEDAEVAGEADAEVAGER
jgi:transcription termination/antitermination protein NusA